MKPWIAAAVVLALGGPSSAQAPNVTSPRQAEDEEKSRTSETVFPAWMAGQWTASPFDVELNSDCGIGTPCKTCVAPGGGFCWSAHGLV